MIKNVGFIEGGEFLFSFGYLNCEGIIHLKDYIWVY